MPQAISGWKMCPSPVFSILLTIKMGNCNHRRNYSTLIELVLSDALDPVKILNNIEPVQNVIQAHEIFHRREPGWVKIALEPTGKLRSNRPAH
jgi:threonine dehydrogenase-like Zn-dependent dehydrogenase